MTPPDPEAIARSVFFIVGAPRSGTTLLQAMLSSHPRLHVPPETEVYMRLPPVLDPSDRGAVLAMSAYFGSSRAFAEQDLDLDRVLDAARAIAGGGRFGRRALLVAMLGLHAERTGRARIGEKSPHHCRHVASIALDFPEAKFIHVVRDPRDVVASRLRVPWTRASHLALARSWVKDVRRHERLMNEMPAARYAQVRHEDVVRDPEGALRRVLAFLGEAYDERVLRFDERADPGFADRERDWKGGTLGPLDPSSIGRYRARLSARRIAGVERIAAGPMARLGYAPDRPARAVWWPVLDGLDRARDAWRKLARGVGKRLERAGGQPASAW